MPLHNLLAPGSIAVVGASDRPSIGRSILRSLDMLRYKGPIYPIHPVRSEVMGRKCWPNINEVDAPIDLAAICLARDRVLGEVEKAVTAGVRSIVIFAGGFAEQDDEGQWIQERIIDLCRANDVVLCGPNCMGLISLHQKSHAYMMETVDPVALTGNVAVVSQSGSVTIGMLADTRRYGFSHVISSGNEAVTTTADYISYLVDDPDTSIIATFIESIRDPDNFVASLRRAHDAGKPVVAVKVGKSARAAAAVQTHTGGLAGEARIVSAILRDNNAIEVNDLEELSEVLAAWQHIHRPRGDRIAVVTGSGGHAELMLDRSAHHGINLPPPPADVRDRIEQTVGPLTGDANPVDAWGQGDFAANFTVALNETASSGCYDAIVLSLDGNDGQAVDYPDQDERVFAVVERAQASHEIPFYLLSTRHGVHKYAQIRALREIGVACLGGISQGLGAIGRLAEWGNRREQPEQTLSYTTCDTDRLVAPGNTATRPAWVNRKLVNEYDGKRILAAWGLRTARDRTAQNCTEAISIAEGLGYPVVMKVVSATLSHRSEHNLVILPIHDRKGVERAWTDLTARMNAAGQSAGSGTILLQKMSGPGIEVIVGVKRDPVFGLFMAVGAGGVLAELLDEVMIEPLPLRTGSARRLVSGEKLARLLDGFRSRERFDRSALHDAIVSVARFAHAHSQWIEGIDVNPLIVHREGDGCTAVDALIATRRH